MEAKKVALTVEAEDGSRIDKYLAGREDGVSRSFVQKLIRDGLVAVNGKKVKANYNVAFGDAVELTIPEPVHLDVKPENIPLSILYEDDDVVLVNKPKNMVVHPAPGHYEGTLVNALLYHCKGNLSGINGVLRPGIVHRIDKDTTGVLVVCKNDVAHRLVAKQIKSHSVTRKYEAIVFGSLDQESGKVEGDIGRHPTDRKKMAVGVKNGKPAVTHYRIKDPLNDKFTHVECTLETGRTHQIRVHMASIHHPVLGDEVYGPKKQPVALKGQALHASTLGFIHPTKKEYMEFYAPLPDYFMELVQKLKSVD